MEDIYKIVIAIPILIFIILTFQAGNGGGDLTHTNLPTVMTNIPTDIQASLTSEQIDSSTQVVMLKYYDPLGQTTNLRFQVLYRDGTFLLDRDEGNPGFKEILDTYTIHSSKMGDELIYRYVAEHP